TSASADRSATGSSWRRASRSTLSTSTRRGPRRDKVPHFLAFDLGAQSGRAILGRLSSGVLAMSEIHRFANEPIHERGSMRWDADGLSREVQRGLDAAGSERLDSVGVDSWGVDYALLDDRGMLVENPYHYRDSRTRTAVQDVLAIVDRERLY